MHLLRFLPQKMPGPLCPWTARLSLRLGSPETFEAKLEQAQHDLGIPSVEQIPIQSLDVLGWETDVLVCFNEPS